MRPHPAVHPHWPITRTRKALPPPPPTPGYWSFWGCWHCTGRLLRRQETHTRYGFSLRTRTERRCAAPITYRRGSVPHLSVVWTGISLRKHPFLLALRRWGRFARRNVCDSATEIPYWILIPQIPKMCDLILVTLLKLQPHNSQSSCKNATPSSGTSPLAYN